MTGTPGDAAIADTMTDADVDARVSELGEACNPLVATSCNGPNSRCAWIIDTTTPTLTGHAGCVPAGSQAVGAACTNPTQGVAGVSNCVAGSECLGGECKTICAASGLAPTCTSDYSCTRYADFFTFGGNVLAGVCDPGCNPLTQRLNVGANRQACGSTDPAMPNLGCFGFGGTGFTCAPTSMAAWALTDRATPRGNAQGNPYINGCAPGFMPLVFDTTGSTTMLCAGLCAALETDSTAAHMANGRGDASALAKLPTAAAAAAGNATCDIGKKGSETSSRCRFLWPTLVDQTTGELPTWFDQSPYRDTLGFCVAIARYRYDSNGDSTPDTVYPECNTLPKRSVATPGAHDDAADFGCQLRVNSPAIPAAVTGVTSPSRESVPVVRHELR